MKAIPKSEHAIEEHLKRNKMREYSANVNDALMYKIRVYAHERSLRERERAKRFKQQVYQMQRANKEVDAYDFLNTTKPCTTQDIEECKNKE